MENVNWKRYLKIAFAVAFIIFAVCATFVIYKNFLILKQIGQDIKNMTEQVQKQLNEDSPSTLDLYIAFHKAIEERKKKLSTSNETVDYTFTISHYIDFLNATEERRKKQKDIIEFFKQIANLLDYEFFLKEKFAKDGIYPEPKEYLHEAVLKHLKPINYYGWALLHSLKEDLPPEKQKELEKLEKENLKTIEEVYKSLKEDKEVQKWIKKIKNGLRQYMSP
jgi:hypothetical protein